MGLHCKNWEPKTMKSLLLLLIAKAGYTSGTVRAETDYKDTASAIVKHCTDVEFGFGTRETGFDVSLVRESLKTEADFGYRLMTEAFQHGVEAVYVEGSNLDDNLHVTITLNNGGYYTLRASRVYDSTWN
jgi:hypothetical protein